MMIRSETMWEIEVVVYDENGIMGKLDLYDPITKMFYEIKSSGAAPFAGKQMTRYSRTCYMVLYGHRVPKTISPGNAHIEGDFVYGNYYIHFYSSKTIPGLIVYDIDPFNPQEQTQEEYAPNFVPSLEVELAPVPIIIPSPAGVPTGSYSYQYGGGGGGGGTWFSVLHPQAT